MITKLRILLQRLQN